MPEDTHGTSAGSGGERAKPGERGSGADGARPRDRAGAGHEERSSGEPGRDSGKAGDGARTSPGSSAEPEGSPPTVDDIAQEAARARRLQRAVDVSLAFIYQSRDLTLGDSIEITLELRRIALLLFPGSEQTFDMLYRPRLMRAIRERFGIDEAPDREGGSES